MLLHEFDPNPRAVINPSDNHSRVSACPRVAVSCFERHTFARMAERLGAEPFASNGMANLEVLYYRARYQGKEIALFNAYVGAAGCVCVIECLFALGVEKLVLFGSCGVLDSSLANCGIIVPTAALRDEGTSYHYAPAGDEIEVNPRYRDKFAAVLDRHGCAWAEGKVWTTDAFYRETAEKASRRRAAGCVCVDMECSAVAALAQFRGKEVFQFFHGADNLDGERWDRRGLGSEFDLTEKDKIAQLALELAAEIA
ncbi:MAG: nucleoside phosphorylase [Oscillospiraceae bacterium]|nr:nucleoside phosphorylase [Oscillospiraceae bacterium]